MAESNFGKLLCEIEDRHVRGAVIDVMDSALLVLCWMEDHEMEPTPADLLGFTKLILSREKK